MNTETTTKPGVLAVLEACGAYVDDAASFPEQFKPGVVKRHQRQYNEARATVERLAEALLAYDQWNYEVESARVNGESVYSYADLKEMREKAAALGHATLAAFRGEQPCTAATSDYMNRLVREQRENPDVLRERLEQDFARILGVPAIPADIARPINPISDDAE